MSNQDFQQYCELASVLAQGEIPVEYLRFCIERLSRGETVAEIWAAWNNR